MVAKKKVKSAEKKYVTDSGIPIKQFYVKSTKKQTKEVPGKFPYTRGIHQGMYRDRFWTMRQYAGFSSAKQTNERFKLLLERGPVSYTHLTLPTKRIV